MEFTKGMTVINRVFDTVVCVTGKGREDGLFRGTVIYSTTYNVGDGSSSWVISGFHPFDLQSAIEEALKKEKV